MGHVKVTEAAKLGDALRRRGNPMTPAEFVRVLKEVAGGSEEALTVGERDFLLASGDLTEEDLSEDALTESLLRVAEGETRAEEAVVADSLTTADVAGLLNRAESNVRRSRLQGDLYAPTETTDGTLRFPRWQFRHGQVVPGVRDIIPAFPRYWHPLSIQRFMLTPHESLDGYSPSPG